MGSEIHFADIHELCSSQYQLSLFFFFIFKLCKYSVYSFIINEVKYFSRFYKKYTHIYCSTHAQYVVTKNVIYLQVSRIALPITNYQCSTSCLSDNLHLDVYRHYTFQFLRLDFYKDNIYLFL